MTPHWVETYDALLRRYLPLLAPDSQLSANTNLTESGLDSMTTIQLLIEVEDTFAVSIPDELLTAETFATAGSLWSVVARLRAEESA